MKYVGAAYLAYLGGVALFAGRVRHLVPESPRTQRAVRYVSGSVLLGFGVKLALDERTSV